MINDGWPESGIVRQWIQQGWGEVEKGSSCKREKTRERGLATVRRLLHVVLVRGVWVDRQTGWALACANGSGMLVIARGPASPASNLVLE